ncbi:MAG TPA: PaaX family transcriptional regulator C-terminal domain-containing protein [Bacillota bacterium]|nr:PaaX family transcriptional regulator C-terminal domain-containing protein [Bacillota bacterium]
MKLILRKNDSATSLLLFIYNNYYSKTSKDDLKLSSLLAILKAFDKNETAIRMSLSRAVKSGFLINSKVAGEVVYTLSPMGKQAIKLWNQGVISYWKRYRLRRQPWDGKWHIINIEFSDDKKQRQEIIDKLEQYGFVLINANTWISPYYQKDEVDELIKEYNLEKRIVEIHGEIKLRREIDGFIESIYCLDGLGKKYGEFVSTYAEKLQQIKEVYKDSRFIDSGKALPLLHELGWHFFNIASDDAVLPMQLRSHWEGDEAADLMSELREMLMEASMKFFEKLE